MKCFEKELKEEVEIAEGRERNNGMWEGVEGRSEDIYGSKKYNRIARLWQTTGNGDEEPIIAGARVRTGEIINPKP